MKKIELHLHLDGSVRPETLQELSDLPIEEVKQKSMVDTNCKDLNQYLEKFDFPLQYMQTKENLERITRELIEDLEREHIIYAEIRFAPILHTKEGLSMKEVVESVLKGLNSSSITCNLILCMMRGRKFEENNQVVELASTYLNKGVCAIDLAGAESLYPNILYQPLFEKAKTLEIPYTIHAGEAAGKNSIYSAISMGAKRIGHGIHIENDENLIAFIKEKDILLEICPTSNVQTNAVTSLQNHPMYSFYLKGLPLSINTDNRTVSNVTLTSELELLKNTFSFTDKDIFSLQKIALQHAFIPSNEKERLFKELAKSCKNW